ncbi:trypsin inhibitor-like [Bacillus rossius redtenbacheri]|uniref:trypsin inhibitor-like n=1 Tax=Bacillus rossius redtenbacheri TaxID=93214 RepID=UPI002FDEDA55
MFGTKLCLMLLCCAAMVVYEVEGTGNPYCNLPMEVGPCSDFTPRYYYNTDTQRCEEFMFGGCEGNYNNFELLFECQAQCEGN